MLDVGRGAYSVKEELFTQVHWPCRSRPAIFSRVKQNNHLREDGQCYTPTNQVNIHLCRCIFYVSRHENPLKDYAYSFPNDDHILLLDLSVISGQCSNLRAIHEETDK